MKVEFQKVPEALLVACPKTGLSGNTYLDVFKLAEARGKDVDSCNEQINAIRQWSNQGAE